jgi:hypothetical protein
MSLRMKRRVNCYFPMNLVFRNGYIHSLEFFVSFLLVRSRKRSFVMAGSMRQ